MGFRVRGFGMRGMEVILSLAFNIWSMGKSKV